MRRIFYFFCLAALFLLAPKFVYAQQDIFINSEVSYTVSLDDSVFVDHKITLINANTSTQAVDYSLNLISGKPQNIHTYDELGDLKFDTSEDESDFSIKVIFTDAVVGEGRERTFHITYKLDSVLERTGDNVEILIPKLSDSQNYKSYLLRLIVPDGLGSPAYITPEPDAQTSFSGSTTYYFNKDNLNLSGISAEFGVSQSYSLDITYHLQNPLALPTTIKIAVPPDTLYQKVTLDSLKPAPENMETDVDGNWLASYRLAPRERLDVKLLGSVQVFASAHVVPGQNNDFSQDLKSDDFWQVDEPGIKALAKELGTPENIYNYVVKTLSYDYSKIGVDAKRLGAVGALEAPNQAICTEFTDLFVTLARSAGIPAREVNGYAYTDNSKFKPLSLVADVLHSWAEYWDEEKKVWVSVDPTWGDTTSADYFSKLDMKHIVFVYHGASSTSPISPGSYKLGANPQKDVFVSLSQPAVNVPFAPQLELSQKSDLPFSGLQIEAKLKNSGATALYDKKITLSFDKEVKYERVINALLPYQNAILEFSIPYGFLGNKIPDKVLLSIDGNSYEYIPDKNKVITRDIAVVAVTIIVSGTLIIFVRSKLK